MPKNHKSTYTIKLDNLELDIHYSYYFNAGTYEYPPEEELEIESAYLYDIDITDLFWNYIEEDVYESVLEYARENNH
jgi:hypothetical protein